MGKQFQKILLASCAVIVTAAGASLSVKAHDEATPPFDLEQTQAVHKIIEHYLLENPKIVMDAAEAYRVQQEQEQQQQAQTAIEDNMDVLTHSEAPSIGPADASVTVVEFFDYNCGYCKRALPDVQKAVEADKDVRFVFKEMPILGPTSQTAAEWALAAHKQGKYFEYHSALMEFRGPKEEAQLAKIATDLGLDVEKMKQDAKSDDIQKLLEEDINLAQKIGISGTPAFIINGELYGGYLGEDGLQAAIDKARASQEDNEG